MKTRTRIATLLAATIAAAALGAGTATAAPPQPDRMSLTSMARHYHCNIVATPGPDWFHGKTVRGWIIGNQWKGYFHIDPALVGWEPHGDGWIKAVCQF